MWHAVCASELRQGAMRRLQCTRSPECRSPHPFARASLLCCHRLLTRRLCRSLRRPRLTPPSTFVKVPAHVERSLEGLSSDTMSPRSLGRSAHTSPPRVRYRVFHARRVQCCRPIESRSAAIGDLEPHPFLVLGPVEPRFSWVSYFGSRIRSAMACPFPHFCRIAFFPCRMFTFLLGSFSRSRLFKDVSLKLVSLYQQEWSKWPGATSSRFRNLFERSANKETTAAVSMLAAPAESGTRT